MKLTIGMWVCAVTCAVAFAFAPGAFAQTRSTSTNQPPPALSMGGSTANDNGTAQNQTAAPQESESEPTYGGTAGFAHRVAAAIERRGTWLAAQAKHYYHKLSGDTKDATLEDNASSVLTGDPRTRRAEISVEAEDGVVTLMGRADSRATASHAGEVVAKLDGVKEVKNEIIYPEGNRTATP